MNEKILVVDDEPRVVRLVSEVLKAVGFPSNCCRHRRIGYRDGSLGAARSGFVRHPSPPGPQMAMRCAAASGNSLMCR